MPAAKSSGAELLVRARKLINETISRFRMVSATGTVTDRAQCVMVGVEILNGLLAAHDIAPHFRAQLGSQLNEHVIDAQPDQQSIDDAFFRTLSVLESFKTVLDTQRA